MAASNFKLKLAETGINISPPISYSKTMRYTNDQLQDMANFMGSVRLTRAGPVNDFLYWVWTFQGVRGMPPSATNNCPLVELAWRVEGFFETGP
jgi:hypothetical protein